MEGSMGGKRLFRVEQWSREAVAHRGWIVSECVCPCVCVCVWGVCMRRWVFNPRIQGARRPLTASKSLSLLLPPVSQSAQSHSLSSTPPLTRSLFLSPGGPVSSGIKIYTTTPSYCTEEYHKARPDSSLLSSSPCLCARSTCLPKSVKPCRTPPHPRVCFIIILHIRHASRARSMLRHRLVCVRDQTHMCVFCTFLFFCAGLGIAPHF